MTKANEHTRQRRTALYNAWAEMNAKLHPDHPGLNVTPVLVAEAVRRARPHTRGILEVSDATRWLTDPGKYSPFVDDVAVRRAADLHRDAFEALSDDEKDAVYVVLAGRENAYDNPALMFSGWGHAARNKDVPNVEQRTERRVRWESEWSKTQRIELQRRVAYARKLMEEKAA